jgi:hypothetical protein
MLDGAFCIRFNGEMCERTDQREQKHGDLFFHRLCEIILRATEDETPLAGQIEEECSFQQWWEH